MFTKLADRLGILDLIAPKVKSDSHGAPSPAGHSGRKRDGSSGDRFSDTKDKSSRERSRLLKAQLDSEGLAEAQGNFAKRQRVRYHHRASNSSYDAVIVGVHHDDGPDKPYYTIKYAKPDVQVDENNGSETVMQCTVEKQTTPDRLDRLPWDEIKAWDAIQQK